MNTTPEREGLIETFEQWFDQQKYSLTHVPNFFQTAEMERAFNEGRASGLEQLALERQKHIERMKGIMDGSMEFDHTYRELKDYIAELEMEAKDA